MTRQWLLTAALGACLSVYATDWKFASPDGHIQVVVSDEGGKPSYQVLYDGTVFLEPSPLGLETNIGDFTQDMSLGGTYKADTVCDTYTLPTIKQSRVDYKAVEVVCPFMQQGKKVCDVVFRVSNRDVAFKYRVYPKENTLCCVVRSEATGFVLPEGSTTFLCPQSKPMGGFARTSPSYETSYTVDDTMGKNGWGEGYTFPCLFKYMDKGWLLLSETGVDSRYCASRLMGHEGGAPIVETTVAFDLVSPLYEASQKYQYGCGTWSWIIGGDASMTYDEQKRYIDFAAAMGYQSVLVDALWDSRVGYEKIEELARYAQSKNVALYLWYNSNGYWNDAPQGPRGKMSNIISRRKEMKWMQSIGIRGIKVDFIGSDKQVTMQLYEDILADANDYGLLVIFHGCTLPRGWEGSCDAEAFNACLHPFIRNTVGSMDFGGSTLNRYYNAKNQPGGSRRVTSDVFALATAVLFQSPVQHFALAPNNLTDAPVWAVDFMKKVPTLWDEVRFIDGYPGKYVILARRHGETWYVAGINASKEPLKVKVALPMFSPKEEVTLYADDAQLQGSVKTQKLDKKGEIELMIPCNGGALIVK